MVDVGADLLAMTRVATRDNEGNLLMIALAATGAQLERICRRFRTAKAELSGMDEEAAADRRFRGRTLGGGLVKLELIASAEEAELVLRAVERARDELRVGAPAPPSCASAEAPAAGAPRLQASGPAAADAPASRASGPSAADALVHLATRFLVGGRTSAGDGESAGDGNGGDHNDNDSDGRVRASSASAERYQVVVHLERDLLTSRAGRSPGAADTAGAAATTATTAVASRTSAACTCAEDSPIAAIPTVAASLDDGTAVSAEAFRRIACDASLVAAVMDDKSDVLDVGRRTRTIPTAIRRALALRDHGCRFPGCANTRFLHGHHIQHWLHGGPTALDNLILVCSYHHRQLHEGGFNLRFTSGGRVELVVPEGWPRPYPSSPPAGDVDPDGLVIWLDDWARHAGGPIDAWTATSSWSGEPVDYGAAVEALMAGT